MRISISVKHNVDSREIRAASERLDNAMVSAVRRGTRFLEDAYIRETPKRSGRTAGKIDSFVEPRPGGATGYIGGTDPVLKFLEDGTRPHTRTLKRPRRAPGADRSDPKTVTTYTHPGMRAQKNLERAGTLSIPEVERIAVDEVGQVFD